MLNCKAIFPNMKTSLYRHNKEVINPSDYQIISGDINGDGTLDILDIISCINIILNT